MKEHMLEAVKRKRAQLQQHEEDSTGEHAEGQSAETGDEELAPASGGSKRDALLGKPDGKDSNAPAESHEESQNQTKLGASGGFDKEVHTSPANSKNLFHDPKKDTHDPVDLNRHKLMGADEGGVSNKYDKMGVNEHLDVRKQSSVLAKHNATKDEGLKNRALASVKAKLNISSPKASSDGEAGMDGGDAVSDNETEGDGNEGGFGGGKLSGLKGARARLDGFLSKMKRD